MSLEQKVCTACEGGVPPLTEEKIGDFLNELEGNWDVIDGKLIRRLFERKDFMDAVEFINKIAELAENEGHHPDLLLRNYKELTVELTTHAIGGLSENDFIVARKIELL